MIKYRAFAKTVELGSMTKAAKALGYSQPGISHMIESLEDEMGFPLFMRRKGNLLLTEKGKNVLNYCLQIIQKEDEMRNMVQAVNEVTGGTIRIGSMNSMIINFVSKAVQSFTNTYSNIEVWIHELPFADFESNFCNGNIDIGFTSKCSIKGLDFIPLFKDPICLIMNENHPFTAYDKIPVSALNGCDFIMPSKGWDDVTKVILDANPVLPNIKHYVASDTAALYMAQRNMGVYIISALQTKLMPEGVTYRYFEGDYHRIMGMLTNPIRQVSPIEREFINVVRYIADKDTAPLEHHL